MGQERRRPAASEPGAASRDDHLRTLGTAVAAVAHEINNPITYVLGNLDELERLSSAMREVILMYRELLRLGAREASSERAASVEAKLEEVGGIGLLDELLADTREGARRIRDLVRDLVASTRGAELRTEAVDVAEILDSTLRLAAPHFPAPTEIERDYRATRRVEADPAKLGQVFLNLLANASDASAAGRAEKARIRVSACDCDGGVAVEIEDSGEGIPEAVRSQLFTPFFSTKPPGSGTGLGLYISRRIVEEHGGTLRFRSAESGGTIFSVFLPLEEG
ncbi:MAG: ATP-binding protein [Myxococcota bacterium]